MQLNACNAMYKATKCCRSTKLNSMFQCVETKHVHTRPNQKDKLCIIILKLKEAQRNFSYGAVGYFNQAPTEIKNVATLKTFKLQMGNVHDILHHCW